MRKRSSYRPRPVSPDPIACAIAGARVTDASILDELRMRELLAIDAFKLGHATQDDWRTVAGMSNIAEALVLLGVGRDDVQPAVEATQAALQDAHARYLETGRVATTGPGLQAMRDLYAWHDAQRTACARSTYERALKLAMDRIKGGHPSNKVCVG